MTVTDLKQDENPGKPELRTIEICESVREDKPSQWWYRVWGGSHVVYHSETYVSQHYAIVAARREHEGRAKFAYVLKYLDEGVEVKETL